MTGKKADPSPHHSGFVACLGRTNVGKSTLLNRLLGQKIGIVSKKPQTTRRCVRGIVNLPAAQIVLVDTPGLPSLSNPLNERLEKEALVAVEGADAVLAVTDQSAPSRKGEEGKMVDLVRRSNKPVLLALNKCDRMKGHRREEMIRYYTELEVFKDVLPLSAKTGENFDLLRDALRSLVPEGPPLYPADIVSDQTERELFAEILREKIFRQVHQELPYAAAVILEDVSENVEKGLYRVQATIYVERESQKGMLIGEGGQSLKRIGTEARRDMERLTGSKIFLSLWVKVRKNWSRDPKSLREFGFDQP